MEDDRWVELDAPAVGDHGNHTNISCNVSFRSTISVCMYVHVQGDGVDNSWFP